MLTRLTLMATVLIAAPAFAQTPASPSQSPPTIAAVMDSCQVDLKTLCGSEPFEMTKLTQCVRQNREKLSPACKAVWPEAPQPRQADNIDRRSAARTVRQACATDLQTHCSGKRARELNLCQRDNQDKFSEACRTAITELRRARQAERRGGNQRDDDEE